MSGDLITYFLPGFGISRSVIQSEIRYFCGPDAIVRPFTHKVRDFAVEGQPVFTFQQGRDGFLVSTAGPPLTEVLVLTSMSRETS